MGLRGAHMGRNTPNGTLLGLSESWRGTYGAGFPFGGHLWVERTRWVTYGAEGHFWGRKYHLVALMGPHGDPLRHYCAP